MLPVNPPNRDIGVDLDDVLSLGANDMFAGGGLGVLAS
jgi:glucan phosphorylase